MFGLFKLKKKSKKDKSPEQNPDDEKENASSPTKVKKLENGSTKSSKKPTSKKESSSSLEEPVAVPEQQPADKLVEKNVQINIIDRSQLPSTPSIPRHSKLVKIAAENEQNLLTVETNVGDSTSQPSPLSTATTMNMQQVNRAPMLSASDATQTTSFVRGNFLSSTISGSDLHRFLNSGYLNGEAYLQRGVELKTPKSPHFHRPPNFSYSRNRPNYITPHRNTSANRGAMRALLMSASSSDTPRFYNRVIGRGRSSSPAHHYEQQSRQQETVEQIDKPDGTTTIVTTITTMKTPVARNLDTEEPIRLSKYPGGVQPGPDEQPKIESLDWPAPPYPAAVPELRARSRSSSNRRAPSTITSIHGTHISVNGDMNDEADSDDDTDYVNDEEVQQVLINNNSSNSGCEHHSHMNNRQSTGAASVSSSLARAKASRPNSKLRYQNNLFDNDYDDYMLRYKSDKDWKKMLSKSTLGRDRTLVQSATCDSYGDLNTSTLNNTQTLNETNDHDEDDEDEEENDALKAHSSKHTLTELKLQRELEEIKKIKHESSMAAELLNEVEAQQKMIISRKLKIDPWKASRTPNAKAEPSVRTRYESPVNASPSRVYNYNRLMTSAISGHTLSATPVDHSNTTSATFIGDISLITNTPVTPTNQHHHHYNDVAMLSVVNPLTPKSATLSTASASSHLNKNQYISSSSRVISSSCLPRAGN